MKSYCKATIYGPTPGPKHSKLEEFTKNELHLMITSYLHLLRLGRLAIAIENDSELCLYF